jgi:hypothetical protein
MPLPESSCRGFAAASLGSFKFQGKVSQDFQQQPHPISPGLYVANPDGLREATPEESGMNKVRITTAWSDD